MYQSIAIAVHVIDVNNAIYVTQAAFKGDKCKTLNGSGLGRQGGWVCVLERVLLCVCVCVERGQ